ncbi:MAG: hypothetical protein SF028_15525 [Candidatus Sumerlaeia bacterium]|nr:hypothetical protein [Candidatus Sumerlaeia bacterium]
MTYRPLTDPKQIKNCFKAFRGVFASRGVAITGVRPYGSPVPEVRWHADLKIWTAFGEDWRQGSKGDWFALFGEGEPQPHKVVDIVLEVNVYKKEPSRQIHGRYFTDDHGTFYVGRKPTANKGKGTTVPIVSEAQQWSPHLVTIDWARKKNDTEQVILIGALNEVGFAERLAALVRTVHAIKSGAGLRLFRVPQRARTTSTSQAPNFSPEFEGDSSFHRKAKNLVIRHDHAKIVKALKAELERQGHMVANDDPRDLYIPARGRDAKILFEVKRSNDTQDSYTAIGQLIFHGARQEFDPVRVLVAPTGAKPETLKVLRKIGIKVVTHAKDDEGNLVFDGLNEVLRRNGGLEDDE